MRRWGRSCINDVNYIDSELLYELAMMDYKWLATGIQQGAKLAIPLSAAQEIDQE